MIEALFTDLDRATSEIRGALRPVQAIKDWLKRKVVRPDGKLRHQVADCGVSNALAERVRAPAFGHGTVLAVPGRRYGGQQRLCDAQHALTARAKERSRHEAVPR